MILLIRQKSKGKQCSGGRLLYSRHPWVPWAKRWKLWVRITAPGLQEATGYQGRWRKKEANCLIFVCLFVFWFWQMNRGLEDFPGGSDVKTSVYNVGDWVQSLGWEDPLEKKMAIHSSTIAWKIPWTEEPGRLQFAGLQRVRHDWATSQNTKIGSQETPGVTGKFGLGVPNEAGQRLIGFCQENTLVIANTLFNNTREDSTHENYQMVNTEMRLIIFFAAKDGEALYSQQKQNWELTVAQIMNSLLPNSD